MLVSSVVVAVASFFFFFFFFGCGGEKKTLISFDNFSTGKCPFLFLYFTQKLLEQDKILPTPGDATADFLIDVESDIWYDVVVTGCGD